MAASDIIALLQNQIGEEMQLDPLSKDRIAVYTPFMYEDGDQCSFILSRDGEGNHWFLTDEGEVVAHAGYSGVDLLAKDRIFRLRKTLEFYGVSELHRELRFRIDGDAFGHAFFTFSQACLDVLQLAKLPPEKKERTASAFRTTVRSLVASVVPAANIEESWYDPDTDPSRVYPVDIRINGRRKPLYVYVVNTEGHCLICAVSCLHHAKLKKEFSGVAIFDDEQAIPKRKRIPLLEAVDQTFSIKDGADQIRSYFMAAAV